MAAAEESQDPPGSSNLKGVFSWIFYFQTTHVFVIVCVFLLARFRTHTALAPRHFGNYSGRAHPQAPFSAPERAKVKGHLKGRYKGRS